MNQEFTPSLTKSMRILLVEDNADDETLSLEVFKSLGLLDHVTVVRDGTEALDYLSSAGNYQDRSPLADPTIIIVDLMLPQVSGFEVIREVRSDEKTRFLPVVIFSSSLEDYDLEKGYQAGANSYIRKPVDFKEFSQALKQIITYWLRWNENVPLPKEASVD